MSLVVRSLLYGLIVVSVGMRSELQAQDTKAGDSRVLKLEPAILTVIDQAELPARDAGTLLKLNVVEGDRVKEGDLLVEFDQDEERAMREKAAVEAAVAAKKRASTYEREFARLAYAAAKADLARAEESERKFAKSISQTELDQLRLEVEKTGFGIKKSEEDAELADLNLKLKERELALAEIKLKRRMLYAPFDGAVVQIHKRPGEWLQPGEKVLRLTRLDRLRIEAFVPAGELPAAVAATTVRFLPRDAGDGAKPIEAKLSFVSPEVNPVNGQVRVWAVVANDAGTLRPGQTGTLEIVVPKAAR